MNDDTTSTNRDEPENNSGLISPAGAIEKAQKGLDLLKAAIIELAEANPGGVKNSEAARILGLQTDYSGSQQDYLTWSVFGELIKDGKIKRIEKSRYIVVKE